MTAPQPPQPLQPPRRRLRVASGPEVRRAALRLARSDVRGLVAVLALGIVAAAAALVPPLVVAALIDRLREGIRLADVDVLGASLVGFALLQTALTRISTLAAARYGERAARRLRLELVERVLALPAPVARRAATGDLVVRTTSDVARVTAILTSAAPDLLVPVAQLVLTVAFLVALGPVLAVTAVVGLGGIAVAVRWYLRRARSAYLEQGAALGDVAEQLSATLAGARTVEVYRLGERRLRAQATADARARVLSLATLRLRSVLFPAIDSSYAVALVLVLVVGAILLGAGRLGLGALVAALLYVRALSAPLDTVLLWLESLQDGLASLARVEGLAAVPEVEAAPAAPRPPPREPAAPAGSAAPAVSVRGVAYRYEDGPLVLEHVDLDVRPGERLAVVGASGAGKSTLARLIAGLEPPTAGTVEIDGVSASALSADLRSSRLALVTQEQHVFADSLRVNLLLARPDAGDDELRRALQAVGADWADRLPDGLDTILGGSIRLHGSEAQQLALARVVLTDPATVVLDEATSLLDPASARGVERSLARALAGRTVVAVAHRLSTARDADRVAVVDAGRVRELGTHAELIAADDAYARLWRAWSADP